MDFTFEELYVQGLRFYHLRTEAGAVPVWFQEFSNHFGPSWTFTPDRRRAFRFYDRESAMSFKRALGGGPTFVTVVPSVFEELALAAA
jgi:hypothetical protein